MAVYGEGNRKRLIGTHETSGYDTFTWGRADRGASVRIGNSTIVAGRGYFEDRRQAANMNPYLVTAKLFETVLNGLMETDNVTSEDMDIIQNE